jgi:hypothetical protein
MRSTKNYNDLIGNRIPDLPACSIVPQPTTLPRTPKENGCDLLEASDICDEGLEKTTEDLSQDR